MKTYIGGVVPTERDELVVILVGLLHGSFARIATTCDIDLSFPDIAQEVVRLVSFDRLTKVDRAIPWLGDMYVRKVGVAPTHFRYEVRECWDGVFVICNG